MNFGHSKKRRGTAYHEAGHAVAGWFHDLAVREVTIVPEPDRDRRGGSNGRVVWARRVDNVINKVLGGTFGLEPKDLVTTERMLLASVCGRAAERRLNGAIHPVGGTGDQRREVDLMLRLGYAPDEELPLKLQLLHLQARRFVERHWQEIRHVAEALLERETLTGNELRELVLASLDDERRKELDDGYFLYGNEAIKAMRELGDEPLGAPRDDNGQPQLFEDDRDALAENLSELIDEVYGVTRETDK